jgi:hypothetical protein
MVISVASLAWAMGGAIFLQGVACTNSMLVRHRLHFEMDCSKTSESFRVCTERSVHCDIALPRRISSRISSCHSSQAHRRAWPALSSMAPTRSACLVSAAAFATSLPLQRSATRIKAQESCTWSEEQSSVRNFPCLLVPATLVSFFFLLFNYRARTLTRSCFCITIVLIFPIMTTSAENILRDPAGQPAGQRADDELA